MQPEINFHVYLGTVRGALTYTQCKKEHKPKYNLDKLDAEVTALEWGNSEQEILIGKRDGSVQFYSTVLGTYTKEISGYIEGKGAVVGIGCHGKEVIVGRSDGTVNLWRKKKNETFSLNLDESASMECMAYDRHRNVLGTGGEKNDLRVWDVEQKTVIFKAKSLGHDDLNLAIPTTIRGICFFPAEEKLVACATREGHVLLYDERAQRKPITKYFETKASFTTMATAFRDRQCFVGTTKGYMQMLDLRQNKCMKTFKSFTGGITGIVCDAVEPFVASASLDRHLRIHNFETKELIYKEYLKMSLTKILMQPVVKEEKEEQIEENQVDEELEDLFDNMETIVEDADLKKVKRKTKTKLKSSKKIKADE